MYVDKSIFEDKNQVELTALKKIEESLIGECNKEGEEKEATKDNEDASTDKKMDELIIIENDIKVEETVLVKKNSDDEKRSITEEDGAATVAEPEPDGTATATEPVPLPNDTK